jgi:ArsR family transcriptional regulator, arsenate/arsenite/antimonite-responsive transcriptional repressor
MASSVSNFDTFLQAIADPARRRILLALKEKGACSLGRGTGLCACDIEERVRLSQPTISHHMRVLENAGLVEVKKQGHWRWYRRNEKKIAEMARGLKGNL